jgi:hypothetical protein
MAAVGMPPTLKIVVLAVKRTAALKKSLRRQRPLHLVPAVVLAIKKQIFFHTFACMSLFK